MGAAPRRARSAHRPRRDRVLEHLQPAGNRVQQGAGPADQGLPGPGRRLRHDRVARGLRVGHRPRRPAADHPHARPGGHGPLRGVGGQPLHTGGRGTHQPRRPDGVRDRHLRRPGPGAGQGGRATRHRPRPGCARPRVGGRTRRQRDRAGQPGAAVQQRRHRSRRRRHHLVHRVRVAVRNGPAAGRRRGGARIRDPHRRAAHALDQHPGHRTHSRRPDRPGRRHRLRPVRRHQAPQQHQVRDVPRGSRCPIAEHLRAGCAVRRHHGVHRPARAPRAQPELPQRSGHLRRRDRAVHHGCGPDPAAGTAGVPGDASPVPPRTPSPRGRRTGPGGPVGLLDTLGGFRVPPPPAARDRRHRRDAGARAPGPVLAAGPVRRRQRPLVQHHPQGVRPAGRRLRARVQRAAAAGGHGERTGRPGGAGQARGDTQDRARRRGRRRRPDQAGAGAVDRHRRADLGAAGSGDQRAHLPAAYRRHPGRDRRHRTARSTSAVPPRSSATSPTSSRPSYRCSSPSSSGSGSCC